MHNHRRIASIVAASFLMLSMSPSHAGIYKWVDKDGQVHYGEQPGNTGAEKVPIRTNETTAPRAVNKDEVDLLKSGQEARDKKRKEAEEKRKVSRENRKLCNEAKSDLQAISYRGRMREINEKGEYSYLSDKQRQQRISAAKKKQKKYCK